LHGSIVVILPPYPAETRAGRAPAGVHAMPAEAAALQDAGPEIYDPLKQGRKEFICRQYNLAAVTALKKKKNKRE
jgi:hypothetical protein